MEFFNSYAAFGSWGWIAMLAVAATAITFSFLGGLPSLPAGGRHMLLAIAHPDDESMFFVPTLKAFKRAGWRVSIICLTNGWYCQCKQ
jgi:hypothetical protein